MANKPNKIIYGGETLIDLTGDTVDATHLLTGITAHDKSGEIITGACTYDSDTQDATAAAADILIQKTAYVRGSKITGTMPNRGSIEKELTTLEEVYTVPNGYHDGSGKVKISATEQGKLIPSNILEGVTILGVVGTLAPASGVTAQAKEATPSTAEQVITPDTDYNYLSQVTVKAIPYTETTNSAGGLTITIG